MHTHSEYLTELPTHTHNEYLTEHQDISHKADKENTYTKTQTDNKISEEIAKAQLGGSGNVSGSVNLEGFLTNGSSFKKAGTYKNNKVRPIVSFSDDDGSIDVINKWLPIIKDKGISISLPIIPDFIGRANVVTWDNLRELQNEYNTLFSCRGYRNGWNR